MATSSSNNGHNYKQTVAVLIGLTVGHLDIHPILQTILRTILRTILAQTSSTAAESRFWTNLDEMSSILNQDSGMDQIIPKILSRIFKPSFKRCYDPEWRRLDGSNHPTASQNIPKDRMKYMVESREGSLEKPTTAWRSWSNLEHPEESGRHVAFTMWSVATWSYF